MNEEPYHEDGSGQAKLPRHRQGIPLSNLPLGNLQGQPHIMLPGNTMAGSHRPENVCTVVSRQFQQLVTQVPHAYVSLIHPAPLQLGIMVHGSSHLVLTGCRPCAFTKISPGRSEGYDRWHRDHARKALRQALGPRRVAKPGKPRPPVYDEDLLVPLRAGWAVMDARPASGWRRSAVRSSPGCGPAGNSRSATRPTVKLGAMSAATIDRRLAGQRQRLQLESRSGTKPGSSRSTASATRAATRRETSVRPSP